MSKFRDIFPNNYKDIRIFFSQESPIYNINNNRCSKKPRITTSKVWSNFTRVSVKFTRKKMHAISINKSMLFMVQI